MRKLMNSGVSDGGGGKREGQGAGARFVRLDFAAIRPPEVLVQHSEKVRLLRVHVY